MNYEKVSVNIGDKELSQMDLLIESGFYSNRSDFINQAILTQLGKEEDSMNHLLELHSMEKGIDENHWFIGVEWLDKAYLEKVQEQGQKIKIKGFGILYFESDIEDQLIFDTIEKISPKI
ncbi:MAG: hypothetical protein ACI4CC_03545, partial [Lachnospiraceae bacterium]